MEFASLIALIVLVVLPFLLAPVYDTFERKVKAAIQSRLGPLGPVRSLLQSWFDLLKLFSKELVLSSYGTALVVIIELVLIALTAILLQVTILTPVFQWASPTWITALLLVFISISSAFTLFRAVSLDNPFSSIGAFREYYISLAVEGFFLSSLAVILLIEVHIIVKILLFCITAIASYVLSGRVPFDIAEAEPEIASGVYIELSGPLLGVATYSLHIKRYILAEILGYTLLKLFNVTSSIFTPVAIVILTPIIWIIFGAISVTLGRTRVDVGPIALLKTMIILMILTLISMTLTAGLA